MVMPDEQQPDKQGFVRHENFESWYANNIQFHPSAWDLRMVFGELDLRDGNGFVRQHTAMTVSWIQAKLMIYFLSLQVYVHELTDGKIAIPPGALPPAPIPPVGDLENDPIALQVYEHIKKAHEEFVASLP
jgi:hypothetical protein